MADPAAASEVGSWSRTDHYPLDIEGPDVCTFRGASGMSGDGYAYVRARTDGADERCSDSGVQIEVSYINGAGTDVLLRIVGGGGEASAEFTNVESDLAACSCYSPGYSLPK